MWTYLVFAPEPSIKAKKNPTKHVLAPGTVLSKRFFSRYDRVASAYPSPGFGGKFWPTPSDPARRKRKTLETPARNSRERRKSLLGVGGRRTRSTMATCVPRGRVLSRRGERVKASRERRVADWRHARPESVRRGIRRRVGNGVSSEFLRKLCGCISSPTTTTTAVAAATAAASYRRTDFLETHMRRDRDVYIFSPLIQGFPANLNVPAAATDMSRDDENDQILFFFSFFFLNSQVMRTLTANIRILIITFLCFSEKSF